MAWKNTIHQKINNQTIFVYDPYLKGYLCYKTIFCHKIALDAQLMIFLFEIKIMFCSGDI